MVCMCMIYCVCVLCPVYVWVLLCVCVFFRMYVCVWLCVLLCVCVFLLCVCMGFIVCICVYSMYVCVLGCVCMWFFVCMCVWLFVSLCVGINKINSHVMNSYVCVCLIMRNWGKFWKGHSSETFAAVSAVFYSLVQLNDFDLYGFYCV